MLRFLQKRRSSRSTTSIEKVTHDYSEIELGNESLPKLVKDDIDSGYCEQLSQSGRSFSCEDLLLVGSHSQNKRRPNIVSLHTSSSSSTDQTSHTPSGSIDDHDYCDIEYKNNPLSSSGRLNNGTLRRIKDATKVKSHCTNYEIFIISFCSCLEKQVTVSGIKMLLEGVSLENLLL